jgi:hypothetical protein
MGLVKMKTTREATAKAITKVETSKVTTMVHLLVWNVILYMRFLHYCERPNGCASAVCEAPAEQIGCTRVLAAL